MAKYTEVRAGPACKPGTSVQAPSRLGSVLEPSAEVVCNGRGANRAALSRHSSGTAPANTSPSAGAHTPYAVVSPSAASRSALSRHTSVDAPAVGAGPSVSTKSSLSSRRKAGIVAAAAALAREDRQKPDLPGDAVVTAAAAEGAAQADRQTCDGDIKAEAAVHDCIGQQDANCGSADYQSQEGATRWSSLAAHRRAEEPSVPHLLDCTDGPSAGVQSDEQQFHGSSAQGQQASPVAVRSIVRRQIKGAELKSAASLYAASGVVDDLFMSKETYVNGGAEPMTKARHQYGLSPRELEQEGEKRKAFAMNLGAWYKAQLQHRARNNTGARNVSRSNSKVSDGGR